MPLAPMRPCRVQGCKNVTRSGRCDEHGGAYPSHRWGTERRPDVKRITGRRLQAMRAALFANEPLCRLCAKAGRVTVATIRDHIVPLAEGGTDDETNTQPLCQACSDLKTREESIRGKHRAL